MIETSIETNENTGTNPLNLFWDVHVTLKADQKTVVFRCSDKTAAERLTSAISDCEDVELL